MDGVNKQHQQDATGFKNSAIWEKLYNFQREQREKLLRQIESLEKQCRNEKQTRKKYELHQQILSLKEQL